MLPRLLTFRGVVLILMLIFCWICWELFWSLEGYNIWATIQPLFLVSLVEWWMHR